MRAKAYRFHLPGVALLCLLGLAAVLLRGVPVFAANDRYVAPAGVDTGNCTNNLSPCLTIAYAVGQSVAGDTIHLAAGTYTGAGNQHITLDKSLTLLGAGPAMTILSYNAAVPWTGGGRNGILEIRADDVTVSELTLRDAPSEGGVALWGARLWKSGGTIDSTTFDHVFFLDNAGRGIELHNNTTVTNLLVQDSLFEDNLTHGIRMSSTTEVNGLTISNTTFFDNGHSGFLQAAGSSYLSGLLIDSSTFQDNAVQALEFGDAHDVVIENSTFSGGLKGIVFMDTADSAGPIGAVTIENNEMSAIAGPAILVDITNTALDAPLTIAENTIVETVDLLTATVAAVDIGLTATQTHAAVEVITNTVTLEGTLGAATAAHALKLSGGLDDVVVSANVLNGSGIGNNGGDPATTGLYLASVSVKFGSVAAADSVDVLTNDITGFVNGISIYDEVGAAFGGLPAANDVTIFRNSLAGNDDFGLRSGASNTAQGICNWWGAASGPSGAGPGTGDAVSTHVIFAPWLPNNDLANSLCGGINDIFVGTNLGGTVSGIHFTDVDIMALDMETGTWSKFFEGKDVGVSTNLTGFTFEPGGCLLMAFDGNEKHLGLGFIKPHDILKFCQTSLGPVTTGTFSVYFDGSDVGISAVGEKLDALEILPDGRLLLSTKGDFKVKDALNNDLKGRDEDILVFDPTTLGTNTTGTFAMYLDGSDVPGLGKEDVTGVYYNPLNGDLHITILGTFTVDGLNGDSNDITILRPDGGGGYDALPYWNGPDDGYSFVLRSMHIDLP